MLGHLQRMFHLALPKEPQAIHFWAMLHVLTVLVGSWWHGLRVGSWSTFEGRFLDPTPMAT